MPAAAETNEKFGNVRNVGHQFFVEKICRINDGVSGSSTGSCLTSYNDFMGRHFDKDANAPALGELTDVLCERIQKKTDSATFAFQRYYCLRNAFGIAAGQNSAEYSREAEACGEVSDPQDRMANKRGDCYRDGLRKLIDQRKIQPELL